MASAAQIRANRQNASRSTGPRTASGRRTVSGNARRHGLNVPVEALPGAARAVEDPASRIAGTKAGEDVLAAARRVARAQIDVQRAQEARHRVLAGAMAAKDKLKRQAAGRRRQALERLGDDYPHHFPVRKLIAVLMTLDLSVGEEERLHAVLDDVRDELRRIDRYEQRALARRKKAVRAFDAAVREGRTT